MRNRTPFSRILPSAICVCSFSCSTSVEPPDSRPLAVVTWNIGLASGYVDYASQRLPHIVATLNSLDADLVCLQEVWTPEDAAAVKAATADFFPYTHHVQLEDDTVGPAACSETESDPLVACVDSHCASIAASEIAGCVLEHCRAEFDLLSDDCTSCVVANIGKEVDEIIDRCKTGSSRFTYRGANGLLLLSRVPLSQPAHQKLESTNTQRSLLGVTVSLPTIGEIAVICTHLAADLTSSGLSYTGPFESWAGENRAQGEVIAKFAANYGSSADNIIVLGDFNSGPAGPPPLQSEWPEASYDLFVDEGYLPFPASLGTSFQKCSYCSDNLLVQDDTPNVLIDHVFVARAIDGFDIEAERVGTKKVAIQVDTDEVETHPSDHYGLRLLWQPSEEP